MTLEQLRIFVAVAERQHITRAARQLNLAQSAVSHAIAELERRHDTRLFDRIGRGIAMTEAGRALLTEARGVLAQADRAEQTLRAFSRMERGSLVLQASQTIAGYWLPRRLAVFRRSWPGIAIRLGIGNTAAAAEAVATGSAELGFIEGAVDESDLDSIPIARDRLVVVTGPEHPWVARAPATLDDLAAVEWVLREPGSGTRSAFERALSDGGLAPERLSVALELPSNEAVRAAVEAGFGATAISASVAASGLEAGLLHHVPFPLPERAFHVLCHRARPRSRIAAAFLTMLRDGRP